MDENVESAVLETVLDPTSEPFVPATPPTTNLRVAVEGCGHGTLHSIYASIEESCQVKGWDGVDLVIIGGDFQAVRNRHDLNVTSMPEKYRDMADFHEYYSGARAAPYLTIFIGGNHEASNHLFELYYGGWVAPNIYYLGAANVLRIGNLRIGGLSGIWKSYDYRKPHFERLPYNLEELTSIFHVRELDVRKLLSLRTQVDVGLSHDWPKGVEWHGDHQWLFRTKRGFEEDANNGRLGNTAAQQCLDRLRPPYWFSAHLHVKYIAAIDHAGYDEDRAVEDSGQLETLPSVPEGQHDPGFVPDTLMPSSFGQHHPRTMTDLSAWHTFAEDDRVTAQAEQRKREEDMEEARRNGKRSYQTYQFDETFKRVTTDDAYGRKEEKPARAQLGEESDAEERGSPVGPIAMLDGCSFSQEAKRRRTNDDLPAPKIVDRIPAQTASYTPQVNNRVPAQTTSYAPQAAPVVHNPDAIELSDSSSDGEGGLTPVHRNMGIVDLRALRTEANGHSTSTGSPVQSAAATSSSHLSMTIREPQTAPTSAPQAADAESKDKENVPPQAGYAGETQSAVPSDTAAAPVPIADQLRAELAALSSNFAEEVKPEVSPALPFPEGITNTVTHFMALDKCEPNRDFLQLLELGSITAPGKSLTRPVKLEYDPEWLAILRVFAPELALGGNATDKVPEHRGETFYRSRIIEEEAWIEENVVKKDLLAVPENFSVTAPVYDDGLQVDSKEMPREVTNPQTVAFCKLIGIECLFDMSEEERSERMERGPRGESTWFREGRGRGRGGRGGGGGRGGRGGRGGGGGRGRGRGGRGNW